MSHNQSTALMAWLCLAAVSTSSAQADDLAAKGRELLAKHQHAVVTVQVVTKLRYSTAGMGSEGEEYKQNLTGTVVDASGLTVLSLSACDPGEMIQAMMAGMTEGSNEDMKLQVNTELSDIKLLREDGTEMPADIVLRDKDLDLAFVRPKAKPSTPLTALNLARNAKAQVLDQVITLNRLGEAAGRSYAASVERICAVVRKPRLFYIPSGGATSTTLGSPAFMPDGNVLGVFVMRSINQKSGVLDLLGSHPEGLTPIVLPADDILKAARQAIEVKAEVDKNAATKESAEGKADKPTP